ncbi:hypothetical protein [Thermococcus alcaliphilus]|uniref:hypothetical protein n=1 Tax=Thermococcus alcaliphilus TaxID=139207 RepID=UPI002091B32C|nr:hypothetical protein [Thermococcus alcaliphilus]MCO6041853.1 hypothetical protein [Thermococcus alcaliphilus]
MKLINKKEIPADLAIKEVINDLLKVFLMNPYIKRPHILVRGREKLFILDRTWYVLQEVVEILANKRIQIKEYYGEVNEIPGLNDKYESFKVSGNEARKFSQRELEKLFKECLKSNGAIISLKTEEQEAIIFIPIRKDLEWI